MTRYSLQIFVISVLACTLSFSAAKAQQQIPTIQSDTVQSPTEQLDVDFTADHSPVPEKGEFSPINVSIPKVHVAPDTASAGPMIKVNLETGEKTVIRHDIPDELPLSGRTKGSMGTAAVPEMDGPSIKKDGGKTPGVQKFGAYKHVSNPASKVNRKFVKLRIWYANNYSVCSGTLIDQEWVLTAAHCVYDADDGLAQRVEALPAHSKGSNPYGTAESSNIFYFQKWNGKELLAATWKADMALVQLKRPVGVVTGYYPMGHEQKPFYQNKTFYSKSYPAADQFDKNQDMYKKSGKWDYGLKTGVAKPGSKRKVLAHIKNHAIPGSSGGGTYAFDPSGNRTVYAVISHYVPKLVSYYTRITSNKFNKMVSVIQNARFTDTDLVALNTQLNTKRIAEGKKLDYVNFTVFNRGTSYTGQKNWSYDLYLSKDDTITTSDDLLGSYQFNYEFKGREAIRVTKKDVKIPLGYQGDYYVGVILNASDKETANNNSEGWDARKLTIKKGKTLTFTSELDDGTSLSGVEVELHPDDLKGDSRKNTGASYKYAPGNKVDFNVPYYHGAYEFVRWEKDNSTYSKDVWGDYTVKDNESFKAVYKLPPVPVTPHKITGRLPEKHTQRDSVVTLKLVNKHSQPINWSIDERYDSSWLSTYPSNGTASAGTTTNISVYMSSDNLKEGGYKDTLLVSNSVGDTARVLVALAVGPPPMTSPSPDDFFAINEIVNMIENMGFGSGLDIDFGLGKYFMGVGASGPTTQPGRAFIQSYADGGWSGFTAVNANNPIEGDQFGAALDIFATGNNPFLAIGAPGMGPGQAKALPTVQQTYNGRVELFEYGETSWQHRFTVQPPELADGAQFGASVAVASDPNVEGQKFVAIGVPNGMNEGGERTGKVYVYKYMFGDLAGSTVIQSEMAVPNGFFGKSLKFAYTGNNPFLIVGAPGEEGSDHPGHAELYRYTGESWAMQKVFQPEQAQPGDGVGTSVAINWSGTEPLIALGAPRADLEGENSGGIYTYRYSFETESWSFGSVIAPNAEVPNPKFGESVQLYRSELSTLLMAGAPGTGNPEFGGEALVYRKVSGDNEWLFRSRLQPSDSDPNADVGRSLFMAPIGGKLRFYAGAPGADVEGVTDGGLTYGFELADPIKLPKLALGQDLIQHEMPQNEEAQKTLEIQSTGKAALTWSLHTGDIPWIEAETDSGTIAPGNSQSINLNLNTARLDTGLYNTDILLETNDTNRDCTYIAMELHVTDKPTGDLLLSDMLVSNSDSVKIGSLLDQQVEAWLGNVGTDPIDSTITVGLYASADDQLGEEDSLFATTRIDTGLVTNEGAMVSMPRGALVPGNLNPGTAHFFMVADYGDDVPELAEDNNTQMREITLVEAPHPIVGVPGGEMEMQFTLSQDEMLERVVQLENSGDAELYYAIPWFAVKSGLAANNTLTTAADSTAPPYLISADPASGSVAPGESGSITVNFSGEEVPVGTYRDTASVVTNDPENTVIILPMEVTIEEGTAIEDEQPLPEEFALRQNYPNPFNPATEIRFELPRNAQVELSVYNMLGRRITTLIDRRMSAGKHAVSFEAGKLPSGAYIYRIEAGSFTETRKMMLLK